VRYHVHNGDILVQVDLFGLVLVLLICTSTLHDSPLMWCVRRTINFGSTHVSIHVQSIRINIAKPSIS
jgi:hypothetical protein